VAKPVTVKSVNGAGATLVDGSRSHRVFTIAGDAILEGLTITNGHVAGNGGGVYLERGGGLVDCVIAGNDSSNFGGGGVYIDLTGTVTRCLISGNTAANQGGAGAYLAGGGAIRDSVITGNQLAVSGGGGVYLGGGGLVQNSMIRANTAPESGGVRCDSLGILENCLLIGNTASEGGGGGISLYYGGLVRNCTVSDNTSAGIDYSSGGIYCENGGAVINSILFFNNAEYPEHQEYGSGTSYSNCCTTPAVGENGVTNEPRLVNWAAGDYRLATNSPCVDAGVDEDWMPAALDFEGKPRVLGPHVDIGAYELIPPSWDADTDGLPDWWEWRYAHSMTGIVSGADADTDGFCNDGEYLAGTDPNDPGSYLGFVAIVMTGAPTGTVVRWQSVDGKYYRLERGTNLSFTMPFDFTVRTNIPGTAPMNTETDSTAVGRGPWFYRIKLE
jgi:parallel beta-helix repeat protein